MERTHGEHLDHERWADLIPLIGSEGLHHHTLDRFDSFDSNIEARVVQAPYQELGNSLRRQRIRDAVDQKSGNDVKQLERREAMERVRRACELEQYRRQAQDGSCGSGLPRQEKECDEIRCSRCLMLLLIAHEPRQVPRPLRIRIFISSCSPAHRTVSMRPRIDSAI